MDSSWFIFWISNPITIISLGISGFFLVPASLALLGIIGMGIFCIIFSPWILAYNLEERKKRKIAWEENKRKERELKWREIRNREIELYGF